MTNITMKTRDEIYGNYDQEITKKVYDCTLNAMPTKEESDEEPQFSAEERKAHGKKLQQRKGHINCVIQDNKT